MALNAQVSARRRSGGVAMAMLQAGPGTPPATVAAFLAAQAEALQAAGWGKAGRGGEPQGSVLCTKAGAGCRGPGHPASGVHCLDYLSMNIKMRDRQEASCSKSSRNTHAPWPDGLRAAWGAASIISESPCHGVLIMLESPCYRVLILELPCYRHSYGTLLVKHLLVSNLLTV